MITVGDKVIKQPYVCVGGKWCEVTKEAVMVNGEWKTVFEKSGYKIRLYSYGTLVKTLTCGENSPIALEAVPTVYDDDVSHYGWTATAGATTADYGTTEEITPTADMELHAVYSYEHIDEQSASKSGSGSQGKGDNYTISITDAVPNSTYTRKLTVYTPSQVTSPYSNSYGSGTGYGVKWSESTSTYTETVNNDGTITYRRYELVSYSLKTGSAGTNQGVAYDNTKTSTYYRYSKTTITYTKATVSIKYRSAITENGD